MQGAGAGPGHSVASGEGPEAAKHRVSLLLRVYSPPITLLEEFMLGDLILTFPADFVSRNDTLVHLHLSAK